MSAFEWAHPGIDGEPCHGSMVIIEETPALWVAQCDSCHTEAAMPKRDAAADHERAFRMRLESSRLPATLREISLDQLNDVPDLALTAAREFAAGRRNGMTLTGAPGTGKTWVAAAAMTGRLHETAMEWWSAVELVFALNADFGDERRDAALACLAADRGLLLDDIDKARATETAAAELFEAIDRRVRTGTPLLVTTNLRLSELATRFPGTYGHAIASRLVGYAEAFEFSGRDRRFAARRLAA